jgi:hypothetical protein
MFGIIIGKGEVRFGPAEEFVPIEEPTMLRQSVRFLPVLMLALACAAMAQGTFAHIAYGAGYTTTFTFVNSSPSNQTSLNLYFYGDNGSTLTPPIQGVTNPTSPYSFTIPAGGAATIVLPDPGNLAATVTGWASLQSLDGIPVKGQGSFKRVYPGFPDYEMAVPLIGAATECIIPFPDMSAMILIPFDNTTGVHLTAFAIANTTSASQTLSIEFDDQSGAKILGDTWTLPANNHTSFLSTDTTTPSPASMPHGYAATAGKMGTLKISASIQDIGVLALLVNQTSGTLTTVLPISQ